MLFFSVLRLEFNHDLCEYYTELDAVRLYGYPGNLPVNLSSVASEVPCVHCNIMKTRHVVVWVNLCIY